MLKQHSIETEMKQLANVENNQPANAIVRPQIVLICHGH